MTDEGKTEGIKNTSRKPQCANNESRYRTEIGAFFINCPKNTSVSDTLMKEVGRLFGMRPKNALPLHRQNDKAAVKRLKKETSLVIQIKKEKEK